MKCLENRCVLERSQRKNVEKQFSKLKMTIDRPSVKIKDQYYYSINGHLLFGDGVLNAAVFDHAAQFATQDEMRNLKISKTIVSNISLKKVSRLASELPASWEAVLISVAEFDSEQNLPNLNFKKLFVIFASVSQFYLLWLDLLIVLCVVATNELHTGSLQH